MVCIRVVYLSVNIFLEQLGQKEREKKKILSAQLKWRIPVWISHFSLHFYGNSICNKYISFSFKMPAWILIETVSQELRFFFFNFVSLWISIICSYEERCCWIAFKCIPTLWQKLLKRKKKVKYWAVLNYFSSNLLFEEEHLLWTWKIHWMFKKKNSCLQAFFCV